MFGLDNRTGWGLAQGEAIFLTFVGWGFESGSAFVATVTGVLEGFGIYL
jgi:hypothetical protein